MRLQLFNVLFIVAVLTGQTTGSWAVNLNYEQLREECQKGPAVQCCLTSVDRMESGQYIFADKPGGSENHYGCPPGTNRNMYRCPSSYAWCEPEENPEDPYLITETYCEKDEDCAIRDGICGPEPMNIYFDIDLYNHMEKYVDCMPPKGYQNPHCEDQTCVADEVTSP